MPDYQHLSRDEVLRLASEKDQLTDQARLALDAEVARRGLSDVDLLSFRADEVAASREKDKEIDEFSFGWIEKKLIGRKNYHHDPKFRIEEFDTTLWLTFLLIPIIPFASYRIRRIYRRWWNFCVADQYRVLEKLPRNWEQILVTWIQTAAVLLTIRLMLPFVVDHFVYRR